jgi:hypothetical protein
MITVSHQGTQISPRQRLMLEQQQHVRSFMNPVLKQQVAETLAALASPKLVAFKPEKTWFIERNETGTLCIAEWMGH